MNIFRISLSLVLLASLIACKPGNSSSHTSPPAEPSTAASEQVDLPEGANKRLVDGLEPSESIPFDLAEALPNLYEMVKGDPEMVAELAQYGGAAIAQNGINGEADIIQTLKFRDETVIPHLQPFIENMGDEAFYDKYEALDSELSQLGILMQTAEGMFTGLGAAPVLQDKIEELASDDLKWLLEFRAAEASAYRGEYPFMNMEDFGRMVVAGEKLKGAESPYFQEVEPVFYEALETMMDVHLVQDPNTRGVGTPMVGKAHTEFYPYATDNAGRTDFVKGDAGSDYQTVMARILENTSSIQSKPENIYVIVTEWKKTEDMAKARVHKHLDSGEDIPHYLRIRRGNGDDQYAVAYRFYDDANKADAALQKIQAKVPEAQLIFVSVKGETLYELGPAAVE